MATVRIKGAEAPIVQDSEIGGVILSAVELHGLQKIRIDGVYNCDFCHRFMYSS